MTKARIFSKKLCPYCTKAKELLDSKGIQYEEVEVGIEATKEDIQEIVDNMGIDTEIKTVPQIFLIHNNKIEFIGGFTELNKYFTSA